MIRAGRGRGPIAVALASLALAFLLVGCGGRGLPRVRLATTTSARDSGLLDWVLPEIEEAVGVEVSVIAVGTGQALELGKRGDADFVLVHDRPREDAFVQEGWGIERRDLMWNDFVVVGPPNDPASIRGGKDAAAALLRLAAAKATFVSRSDDSGTHSREKSIWKKAGGRPAWSGYLEASQPMGATLLMASEKRAYTLSDRGTYATMRKRIDLVVLVDGDPILLNPYGVMLVNPARNPGVRTGDARRVVEWLTSPAGQARIDAFRIERQPIFRAGPPPK